MFKKVAKVFFALILLFIAYLFFQAGQSAKEDDRIIAAVAEQNISNANLQRIAFGSCNRQDKPQGYWEQIASYQPDQWIWLGDNIYGDSDDPSVLQAKYATQKTAPPYAAFIKKAAVYGIYDDHDYGLNDGGKDWALRDTAKSMMLDFLDVPASDPSHSRAGAYQSYLLGEPREQVRLILLDTRYFRDVLEPNRANPNERYFTNEEGDILGEEQWSWLENILATDTSQVTLIASSIQVLTVDHPYEKWALFPRARKRLLTLLQQFQPQNLVLLSGDRHLAEAAAGVLEPTANADFGLTKYAGNSDKGFCFVEVTSSGLTHSYESADEENRLRISKLVGQRNFGLITIDWTEKGNPTLLIQVLSPEGEEEFFRVAMQSGKLLPDAGKLEYSKPMTKNLKPCPESPNCVSTQTSQEQKKMEPLRYVGDMEAAKRQLREVVGEMARTTLLEESNDYLHFSFTTLPIPFKDDVEFIFDDAAKLIHFRSSSRVGYSDMGVNARRMKKISRRWADAHAN